MRELPFENNIQLNKKSASFITPKKSQFYESGYNFFPKLRENKQRLCKFSENLSNKNKQRLSKVQNS